MNMKELIKLKMLLEIPDGETGEDPLLTVLLMEADAYMRTYCRLSGEEARELREKDPLFCEIPILMAAEDYGRMGSEGVEKRAVSGVSETYRGGYSPKVTALLRRYRRMGLAGGIR